MGKLMLENVTAALRDAGFAVARGFPGGKMAAVSKPVCAVNLQAADLREQTATALVTVLSPAGLGASACEESALAAAQVLAELGGKCAVDACGFNGRTGLYSARITARFYTSIPKVSIDGTQLMSITAFTSWRTVDDEITDLDDAPWNFRVEEFFPVGVDEEPELDGAFTLVHTCEAGTKTFAGCTWTYQRRVWSADGVRQIRLGMAESMQDG